MSRCTKILCWNARGIRNKKLELFNLLESNNIDICLLSETWLNNNTSMKHNDFHCYRSDRLSGRGGGVAILINKKIKHQVICPQNTALIENIGVKLFFEGDSVNIFACYFPGGTAGRDSTKKQQFMSDLRKLTSFQKYLLGGDLNCRHNYWGCHRCNTWGNILYNKLRADDIDIKFTVDSTYQP